MQVGNIKSNKYIHNIYGERLTNNPEYNCWYHFFPSDEVPKMFECEGHKPYWVVKQ